MNFFVRKYCNFLLCCCLISLFFMLLKQLSNAKKNCFSRKRLQEKSQFSGWATAGEERLQKLFLRGCCLKRGGGAFREGWNLQRNYEGTLMRATIAYIRDLRFALTVE